MTISNDAPADFRSLDPDLPSVAALAAAEIDALIRQEKTSFGNVGRLANVLNESFSNSEKPTATRHLLDPISATVFAETIRDSYKQSLQSYEDLAEVTSNLAHQMNRITEVENDALLATIKEFCLALSRYALASKGRIESPTPGRVFHR